MLTFLLRKECESSYWDNAHESPVSWSNSLSSTNRFSSMRFPWKRFLNSSKLGDSLSVPELIGEMPGLLMGAAWTPRWGEELFRSPPSLGVKKSEGLNGVFCRYSFGRKSSVSFGRSMQSGENITRGENDFRRVSISQLNTLWSGEFGGGEVGLNEFPESGSVWLALTPSSSDFVMELLPLSTNFTLFWDMFSKDFSDLAVSSVNR